MRKTQSDKWSGQRNSLREYQRVGSEKQNVKKMEMCEKRLYDSKKSGERERVAKRESMRQH